MSILCSVVAKTPTGKFFVAKGINKAVIPGLWFSGVVESKDTEIFEETIRNFYITQFNADIDFIKGGNDIERILPISTYAIESDKVSPGGKNIIINGFYFAGILRNPNQISIGEENIYSEYMVDKLENIINKIGYDVLPEMYYNFTVVRNMFSAGFNDLSMVNDSEEKNLTDELDMDEFNNTKENNSSINGTVEGQTLSI